MNINSDLNFLQKFFGYFKNEWGGVEPYWDNLGPGAYEDFRHYIWIILTIVACVVLYKVFKNHKKAGWITVVVLMCSLFGVRLINQIVRASIGAENPAWRAIPFHMCTVLTFLLPIVVVFQIDKLKTPVYVLSIMGGVITILIGDYFDDAFTTFSTLEGMTAHSLLILVPILEIALGHFSIKWKESWQIVAGILVLMAWATLANKVFFKDYNTNYMYLERNALPGNIGGDYFFLVYAAIFVLFSVIIFGVPELYRYVVRKRALPKEAQTN